MATLPAKEAEACLPAALTKLGNPDASADRELEVIQIHRQPELEVILDCSEFTCRCPITNQPDWARIEIAYAPDKLIVESKSVKLYLETWREVGIFHEELAQQILKDFVRALRPVWLSVTARFNTRGGIAISATAQYYKGGEEDDEDSNPL